VFFLTYETDPGSVGGVPVPAMLVPMNKPDLDTLRLETPRLILRPLRMEDFDAWAAMHGDEITMKFIGLVESSESAQKIAILSDGRGIYEGREGDIIEGRYRILRIGVESVEMAYLDGRGRQTIRLSGS